MQRRFKQNWFVSFEREFFVLIPSPSTDIINPTDEDCINVRFVCECVTRRSAHLVAAALAALINKINQPVITVGIQGTVYNEHPHYHNVLFSTLRTLIKRDIKVNAAGMRLFCEMVFVFVLQCEIVGVEDGSGRGAALLAAALSKRYTEEI